MGDKNNGKGLTKADLILSRLDNIEEKLMGENAKLRQDIRYLSAQLEGVCMTITQLLRKLPAQLDADDLAIRIASKIIIPEGGLGDMDAEAFVASLKAVPDDINLDYEALGYTVAKSLYIPSVVTEEINYEELAKHVADKMPPVKIDYEELGFSVAKRMYVPQAVAEEVDYDEIARRVVEKVPALGTPVVSETAYASAEPVSFQAEFDYDLLAAKVAEAVSVQDPVSPDYIASKVAEQIVIPQGGTADSVNIDVEELSRKVADKIALPDIEASDLVVNEDKIADAVAERLKDIEPASAEAATFETDLDEETLARSIAERLNFSLSDELIANAVVKNLANAIDSDEIADCVAKRVGTISPEQFEITVDDDGCDSLARAVESKLDYETIASAVAEKLNPAFMGAASVENFDTEELAKSISEKISLSGNLDEDVIADKAAAILSNYMPEVDSDDIADKVLAGIIPALPSTPVVDDESIADAVSERLIERQTEAAYNAAEAETEETAAVSGEYDPRFDKLDGDIQDIKGEYDPRFDKLDVDVQEIKDMLKSGVVVAAGTTVVVNEQPVEETTEELITVSDIVGETEEVTEEETQNVTVIGALVDEINEEPTDGEAITDDDESEGGVDFANMMKYNRSFIARIIQGTDEQKTYYGQIKTALLSYRKVNSNVAWGSERFNKGRETIARLKIRGKTLCLYLALDPNEFPISVYHQVDASNNKSMHGTPMMVKVKSPLGVRKAYRLIDEMLARRNGEKREIKERDYAAMYPYETIEELIEDGLVKDVDKD